VHLDATEHNGELIFLHSVKPGPANQSYGLQVAALAGVPKDVIRRARSYLKTLESQRASLGDSPQGQLPLTVGETVVDNTLRDAVAELDPDSMSPREALAALYKLKGL
jgi:DNA mismatch repair protein MutS